MRLRTTLLLILSLFLFASACSEEEKESPIKPGESCDISKDSPCEDGFSCLGLEAGEGICGIEAGATCELDADPSYCAEGTQCETNIGEGAEGASCLIPAGETCDPNAETAFCSEGLECFEEPAKEPVDEPTEEPAEGENTELPIGHCLLPEGAECDATLEDPHCAPNTVCATRTDGTHACFPPLYFQGHVQDAQSLANIEGAHLIALSEEGFAVTNVAISEEDGSYRLELPTARDEDGKPESISYTLRASADAYQTFPGGLRTALPISLSTAEKHENSWVVEGPLTEIALLTLQNPSAPRQTLSGKILAEEKSGGVLVVVEGPSAHSGLSDLEGHYTVFNVPPGSFSVKGYAANLQLNPVDIEVSSEDLNDIDLSVSNQPNVELSGNIQIVNAPGGSVTSVVLVVDSTFNRDFVRGEVPRGLRAPASGAPDVDGDWIIEGVPIGRYAVLAAFENDQLVRDPDSGISGTDLVFVEVTGAETNAQLNLAESFKVTEALEIFGPGADEPEEVSGAPDLRWADDSSEDYYIVEVFNAFGEKVWEDANVPGAQGVDEVTRHYDGPLEPGMYYQFRVSSWKEKGGGDASAISLTEDLKGVFFSKPSE